MWVRGLKLDRRQDIEYASLSHPVWVRGLKQPEAPFNTVMDSMSHPVWVRGLKQQHAARYDGLHNVAPRVGAWIETIMRLLEEVNTTKSHPVWVRGLKQDTENGE